MPFLRKYGTGTGADVYVPMVKRGVVDFAVSGDWTPSAGDVKVSKDGGTAASIGTLPVAVTMGNTAMWKFVFSDAELQCKALSVTVADSATKAVEDQMFAVETYGHASAMYQADVSAANLPANVTQLLGTAWLTPGVAGTPDVNAKLLGGTAQTGRDVGTSVLVGDKTGFSISGTTTTLDALQTALSSTHGAGSWATATGFSTHTAADVWANGTRTLSAFAFSVTVGTNGDKTGYSLTQTFPTNFADLAITATTGRVTAGTVSDKTGYALTSGERTAIANEVEAQIIDDTDSEKVLAAITDKIAAVNPSLSGLTLSAIAAAVRDVSNSSPAAGSLGEAVRGADAKAADIQITLGAAGAGLTALATAVELAKVPKSDSTVTWNATALGSINAQADTALADYDGPTNAEMVARTIAAASYATAGSAMTLADGAIATAKIADGAITDAKFTFPAEVAGRPTTFLAWVRRMGEWMMNKRVRTRSTGAVVLRNAADSATLETQAQSTTGDTGSEVDTQTKGV